MRASARSLAGALLLVAGAAAAAEAQTARCTHETLAVDGGPLTATLCARSATGGAISIAETFARGGRTVAQQLTLVPVPGAAVTRAVQDVALQPLGMANSLHVQIAFRDGEAAVEHALLLPGAIVLK